MLRSRKSALTILCARRLAACLAIVSAVTLGASDTPAPSSVTVAGSLQSELGCPGDWQPECASTFLTYDAGDDVWQATFDVPSGTWEYKAALNGSWSENYGRNAQRDGAERPADPGHRENREVLLRSQEPLGCGQRQQRDRDRSGQLPIGVGLRGRLGSLLPAFVASGSRRRRYLHLRDARPPPGAYEAKIAVNECWDVNYGAGGVQNGPNIPFSVSAPAEVVTFSYNAVSHVLMISSATTPEQPSSVTIVGSLQSELGCPGDWQPDCAATHLAFHADDEVWQAPFDVPAGNWEYKAALNGIRGTRTTVCTPHATGRTFPCP